MSVTKKTANKQTNKNSKSITNGKASTHKKELLSQVCKAGSWKYCANISIKKKNKLVCPQLLRTVGYDQERKPKNPQNKGSSLNTC